MGELWPTHFRCAYHGETFPFSDYQAHCDEKHDGLQIAGYFMLDPDGTSEPERSEGQVL